MGVTVLGEPPDTAQVTTHESRRAADVAPSRSGRTNPVHPESDAADSAEMPTTETSTGVAFHKSVDRATATSGAVTATEMNPRRAVALVLAAVLVWRVAHTIALMWLLSDVRLVVALSVEAVTLVALVVAGIGALRAPASGVSRLVIIALFLVSLAPTVSAIAANNVWLVTDAALAALVGAIVLTQRQFTVVAAAAATSWLGMVAYALLQAAMAGGRDQAADVIRQWVPGSAVILSSLVVVSLAAGQVQGIRSLVGQAYEDAESGSVRDKLTGMSNQRGLEMVAAPMVEQAWRMGQAVHGVYISIDGLTKVNTAVGRASGDAVLMAVADAVQASIRGTDVAARWRDDEFVVVGPGTGTTPRDMEQRMRARLREAKADLVPWVGTVSVGSAMLVPWDDVDLHAMVRRAERDMQLRRSLRRQNASHRAPEVASNERSPMKPGSGVTEKPATPG